MREKEKAAFLVIVYIFSSFCYILVGIKGSCSNDRFADVDVLYGKDVTVDGILQPNEWSDAALVQTNVQGNPWCLYYKQTGKDLLIAYDHPLENMLIIYFDIDHDEASYPRSDDLQIHSSLSDFESRGTGTGWGEPDLYFDKWEVAVDEDSTTRELRINYTKLGLIAGSEKTIGVCFEIKALDWSWSYCIPTDANVMDPSSWEDMISSIKWEDGIPVDEPPVLEESGFEPSSGDTTTTITFQVVYSDKEGKPPTEFFLNIDGIDHSMDQVVGDPCEGIVYRYSATLIKGTHEHFFRFSDGKNEVRLPNEGFFEGPVIKRHDEPPSLMFPLPEDSYFIFEDSGEGERLIDLEEYFWDDHDDGTLTFEIDSQSAPERLEGKIDGSHLSVSQVEKDWNGPVYFQVSGMDLGPDEVLSQDDQKTQSNLFCITILPVNDPPEIISIDGVVPDGKNVLRLEGPNGAVEDEEKEFEVRLSDVDIETGNDEVLNLGCDNEIIEVEMPDADPSRAVLRILPSQEDVGNLEFGLWVVDSRGERHSIQVSMDVMNINEPPKITSLLIQGMRRNNEGIPIAIEGIEDSWLNFTVEGWDPDIPFDREESIAFQFSGEGYFGTIDGMSGEFSYLPTQEDVGIHELTISITDGSGLTCSMPLMLDVRIMNSNDPPRISNLLVEDEGDEFQAGDTVNISIEYIDEDEGWDPLEEISIQWISDIQGFLGDSRVLSTDQLIPGDHNIDVRVRDRMGEWDSEVLRLRIVEKEEPGQNDTWEPPVEKDGTKRETGTGLEGVMIFVIVLIGIISLVGLASILILLTRRSDIIKEPTSGRDPLMSRENGSFTIPNERMLQYGAPGSMDHCHNTKEGWMK
ncbi:MAG: hypothetical protein ACMUIE_00635 [Thermoplasmatota archaeon]